MLECLVVHCLSLGDRYHLNSGRWFLCYLSTVETEAAFSARGVPETQIQETDSVT